MIESEFLLSIPKKLFVPCGRGYVYLLSKHIDGITPIITKRDIGLGNFSIYNMTLESDDGIHIGYYLEVPRSSKVYHNIICVRNPLHIVDIENIPKAELYISISGLHIYTDTNGDCAIVSDVSTNAITKNL